MTCGIPAYRDAIPAELPNGTRVLVTHEAGTEPGTIVGQTHGPDAKRYDVRFDDGTMSSWPAHRVELAS